MSSRTRASSTPWNNSTASRLLTEMKKRSRSCSAFQRCTNSISCCTSPGVLRIVAMPLSERVMRTRVWGMFFLFFLWDMLHVDAESFHFVNCNLCNLKSIKINVLISLKSLNHRLQYTDFIGFEYVSIFTEADNSRPV